MKSFKFIIISVLSCLLFTGCAPEQSNEPIRDTQFLLNTLCTITIYKIDGQDEAENKQDLIFQAFDLIVEYEALFSMTIENSDVWRINHAGGEETTVSQPTIDIIKQSLMYSELSDGMFDITIGRLTNLWKSSEVLDDIEAELPNARETVDFKQIELSETGKTVRLNNPDAQIDLGGIAKGYIADRVSEFLIENGVKSALIDLGGDIITIGSRTQGDGSAAQGDGSLVLHWRIAVREPFGSGMSNFFGIINTGEAAIVTSGIYERYFENDGIIYHHIIDPTTGYPSDTDVVSATVVSEKVITGDVLASIIVLIGSEKAEPLLNQVPGFIGALLILDNGEYIIYGDVDFTVNI